MLNQRSVEFSIIIPTFNSENVIGNAIASILRQEWDDFEIIVQDGRSVDRTLEIVRGFNDDRICVFSENDEGIFDAMNKGIKRSSGRWLMFLGSDDALFDSYVLKRIAAFQREHPASRFIYGDVLTSANSIQRYNNYTYARLLKMSICHQSIVYHHSLFDNFQYDVRFRICADWDFNLKVFRRRNRPAYIDSPIACFNLNGASSNWWQHPEYLEHFANTTRCILRYRGLPYVLGFYSHRALTRVKMRVTSIRRRLNDFLA